MSALLEVCCADVESVRAACLGGADRIELCSSLETGGLTPSAALIRYAVRLMPRRLNVLIRPRAGDFLYTPGEVEVMLDDIRHAVAAGASGIVCGALTADGDLDTVSVRRMREAAAGASFTLHRAFDMCRDPRQALRQAIGLGCDRILTSGLAPDAVRGADTLRMLTRLADGRIIILAGGGVTPDNAAWLATTTGVRELHASCKRSVASRMRFRRGDVNMGTPGADEFSHPATDKETVSRLAQTLHNLHTP